MTLTTFLFPAFLLIAPFFVAVYVVGKRRVDEIEVNIAEPAIREEDLAKSQWLSRAFEKVSENIPNPEYRVEDFAKDMNISKSSLIRKLKKSSNMTPGGYIREVRMQHAKKLDEEGGKTVAELASACGYKHVNNFSKNFEKRFGHRPNGK